MRYSTCKYTVTLKPRVSLKVIENDTIQSGTHDFLLTFHSNHRPVSHRFRDKRRFLSKIVKFSHPRVLIAPAEGVPLGISYRCNRARGHKSLNDGATRWSKTFYDRFTHLDTIPAVTDRRTVRETRCRSKDPAYYVARAENDLRKCCKFRQNSQQSF